MSSKIGSIIRDLAKKNSLDLNQFADAADKVVDDLQIGDLEESLIKDGKEFFSGLKKDFQAKTATAAGQAASGNVSIKETDGHVEIKINGSIKTLKVNGQHVDIPTKVQ